MNLDQLDKQIAGIEAEVDGMLRDVGTVDALRGLETSVLGKKGSLGSLIASVKDYPPEQRGQVGKAVNQAKQRVKALFDQRLSELQTEVARIGARQNEGWSKLFEIEQRDREMINRLSELLRQGNAGRQ